MEAPTPASQPPVNDRRWQTMAFKGIPGVPIAVASGADIQGDGADDVVLGTPLENDGHGGVVAYYGGTNGLKHQPDWSLDADGTTGRLGHGVALADIDQDGFADLVVTEYVSRLEALAGRPALYLFRGSATGLPQTPAQRLPARLAGYHLQAPIALAGDINGDGFPDLSVSATLFDAPENSGEISHLIFLGSPTGLGDSPAAELHSERPNSGFSAAFGSAGDVNGDGYGDFFVGASQFSGLYHHGGKAYLYLGSRNGLNPVPAWTAEYPLPVRPGIDDEKNQLFGGAMATAGDVNADGRADLIVGAPFASHGDINEGVALLYLGTTNGLSTHPAWFADGNRPHVRFGHCVGSAGDLNGDGFADVVVGAPGAENGQKDEGVVLVFHGRRTGLQKSPAWTFDGDRSHGRVGEFVRDAGDLNGDGSPDLLLGSVDCEQSSDPRIRLVAVYGTADGLRHSSHWRIDTPLLTGIQRWLDHVSRGTFWLITTGLGATAIVVLLLLQSRLKHRIAVLVERNRELVLAEERARLARDIHDHLGADLTHLAVKLEDTRQRADSARVQENLASLSRFTGQLLENVRELVWATSPQCDTLDSLASFLSEQGAAFLQAHAVRCELDIPFRLPRHRVSASLRHNLVLMLKESLHNVVQHSGATRVEIGLRVSGDELLIWIQDDGRGFDTATVTARRREPPGTTGGFGLRNLQARAVTVGGRCSIKSQPGHGTHVEIRVPLDGTSTGSPPVATPARPTKNPA